MIRLRTLVFCAVALGCLLSACGREEAIPIGFIGGLSGRVSDLGIDGRDGAILAIEQRNEAGGIGGRDLRLLIEDDEQNPGAARQAFERLAQQNAVAVIGPMTSSMAVELVDEANARRLPLVSPTVTARSLAGIDDYFIRVISTTGVYAGKQADFYLDALEISRLAVVFDETNWAYASSWLEDFERPFEQHGGQIVRRVAFRSSDSTDYHQLARQLVGSGAAGVLVIANSVDAAQIAQQIRKLDATIRIGASEWAATERLVELGGKAVEGMHFAQIFDRESGDPKYRQFRQAFIERFAHEPGFAAVAGYDAANVVITALASPGQRGDLKGAILSIGSYPGLQGEIRIDRYGDSERRTYLTTIRDGRFVSLE